MRRLRVALLGVAVAVLAAAPAAADVQRIGCDGTVHRIDVDTWYQGGKPAGTTLRYTKQKSKGGREIAWVTGTADSALDRDPALEIGPDDRPVVVWARNDGSGFDVFASRLEGGVWTSPIRLIRLAGDEFEPQVRFDARYLHVSFRSDVDGMVTLQRVSFYTPSWDLAFGPETIGAEASPEVSPQGGQDGLGASEPSRTDRYFCATLFANASGVAGRARVWGVRDEPVPITFLQAFTLPAEVKSTSAAEAGWIGGRFTFWFTSCDKLYYTVLKPTGWADMRIVELSSQTTEAQARLLLIDLNTRESDPTLP